MKDYSQNCEQRIILDYFGEFRGMALEIGANDGILLSNSRALIELGWDCVLVEPAETAFRKLCQHNIQTFSLPNGKQLSDVSFLKCDWLRRNGSTRTVHCVQAAITTQDGPIDFYDSGTHLNKGDTSLLSTTRPEELARWKKSGEVFTKTTVRGITFETLMRETGVRHYDMISIDAEGCDYDILNQIDLTGVGCRLLCVEFNQHDEQKFTDYARQFGMKLHHKNYENLIFAK